jgi:hypothetical protein
MYYFKLWQKVGQKYTYVHHICNFQKTSYIIILKAKNSSNLVTLFSSNWHGINLEWNNRSYKTIFIHFNASFKKMSIWYKSIRKNVKKENTKAMDEENDEIAKISLKSLT